MVSGAGLHGAIDKTQSRNFSLLAETTGSLKPELMK